MNVRTVVKSRMKQLGVKPYDLTKLVKGKVSAPTVYAFVKHDRAINSRSLGHVLVALGLEIRPKE